MSRLLSRAALALVLVLAGCGPSGGADVAGSELSLLTAGAPGGALAPVLLAHARGYDEAEGVALTLRPAGDAYELLTTGRVDAAIVGVDDLRAPLVAVMAFVQDDEAGRPRRKGEPGRPGVVLAVTRDTLADHRDEVAALIRGIQRGMLEAADDPDSAVAASRGLDDTLDRGRLSAELERAAPGFTAGAAAPGAIDAAALRAWGRWAHHKLAADATLAKPINRD
jgi:ABC-type nitrate/sulfonate/bicarbonate transport system substrate-binding protein